MYESFESLLGELGIQIEINGDHNEIQDVTRSIITADEVSAGLSQSEVGGGVHVNERRASFHSADDAAYGGTELLQSRRNSRSSISRLQIDSTLGPAERPSTRASTRPTEKTARRPSSGGNTARMGRGRLTAEEFATNLQHYQRRQASTSGSNANLQDVSRVTTPGFFQQPPHDQSSDSDGSLPTSDSALSETGRREANFKGSSAYQTDFRELFYRPSETQLLRDADTFYHFWIRTVARNALRRWQLSTLKTQNEHFQMWVTATTHDHGILVRESFRLWRSGVLAKRQTIETERYFARLEQRAGSARDLYLMTKAFTHWQQSAHERTLFAFQARRHILSIKYFNAWFDLTVSNQQILQRLAFRKHFTMWRQRLGNLLVTEDQALLIYDRQLVKSSYWTWFWTFCERRAPQWQERNQKTTLLNRWIAKRRQIYIREYELGLWRAQSIKRAIFLRWVGRARSALSCSKQANDFHQRITVARFMLVWRRVTSYAPIMRRISDGVDWRVAGSTFMTFVGRFRTEKQAGKVSRLRVIRNGWTFWNDRLRWQTLQHQINDRVLVEGLYKWVLAERCILLRRLCDQRLKQKCLWSMIIYGRERTMMYEAKGQSVKERREATILQSITTRWRQRLENYHRERQVAFEFYAPRLAYEVISCWMKSNRALRGLHRRATDIDYYFLCTNLLRRWQGAATLSKRNKVREAYAQARRKNKMILARNVVRKWHDRTRHIISLGEQAHSHDQNRLLRFSATLFDDWKRRHSFLFDREYGTAIEFKHRFIHDYLDRWIARLSAQKWSEDLARVNAELRISNIAFGWLHKLHLHVIERKGREGNAESLRRLHQKRRSHNLLRQWHSRVTRQRDQSTKPSAFSARTKRLGVRADAAHQEEVAAQAEEWTAFDDAFELGDWIPTLEAQSDSTPLPGYLSTPSKRAARARGLVGASTTPAGTPFGARLRSQLNPNRRPLQEVRLRKPTTEEGSTFKAIEERYPRTPGGS